MLTCDEIDLELSAYRDGELSDADRATVELHLSNCAACKLSLEEIDNVRKLLSQLPKAKTPERVKTAIHSQIAAPIVQHVVRANFSTVRSNNWAWAVGLAAALMISLLGYVTYFQSGTREYVDSIHVAQVSKDAPTDAPKNDPKEGREFSADPNSKQKKQDQLLTNKLEKVDEVAERADKDSKLQLEAIANAAGAAAPDRPIPLPAPSDAAKGSSKGNSDTVLLRDAAKRTEETSKTIDSTAGLSAADKAPSEKQAASRGLKSGDMVIEQQQQLDRSRGSDKAGSDPRMKEQDASALARAKPVAPPAPPKPSAPFADNLAKPKLEVAQRALAPMPGSISKKEAGDESAPTAAQFKPNDPSAPQLSLVELQAAKPGNGSARSLGNSTAESKATEKSVASSDDAKSNFGGGSTERRKALADNNAVRTIVVRGRDLDEVMLKLRQFARDNSAVVTFDTATLNGGKVGGSARFGTLTVDADAADRVSNQLTAGRFYEALLKSKEQKDGSLPLAPSAPSTTKAAAEDLKTDAPDQKSSWANGAGAGPAGGTATARKSTIRIQIVIEK